MKNFYSKLRGGMEITPDGYKEFIKEFHSRGCVTMMDWLRVYNEAGIIPLIKALNKTERQYYPNEIDMNLYDLHPKQSSQDEETWRSPQGRPLAWPHKGCWCKHSHPICPGTTLHAQMQQRMQWNRLWGLQAGQSGLHNLCKKQTL